MSKNLLITGAARPNSDLVSKLENAGWSVTIHPQEIESVPLPERYDAVICNNLFTYNDIENFANLKVIQLTSAGLDRVPLDYINQHQIKIFNARGVYSIPMAEWVIGVILNHFRGIKTFQEQQKRHNWSKIRNLQELNTKHVAIIGAGNIGCEVAKRLNAFETQIIGFDIKVFENQYFNEIKEIGQFKPNEFDIVILTAPYTPQTHHLINKTVLKDFKKGGILINLSRGGLINQSDFIEVLTKRNDLTAILDVFEQEPLPENSKMWDMPNIQIFPHNSFVGENNDKRLHSLILSNLSENCLKD